MTDFDQARAILDAHVEEIKAKRVVLRDRLNAEAPGMVEFMAEAKEVLGAKTVKIEIDGIVVFENGRIL